MPEFKGKITLDELLKAKRNEKPNPEFWVGFERELKSKQRQLIQQQLVKETRIGSVSTKRYIRFGAFATTMSFAAFAVFIGIRTTENTNNSTTLAEPETQAPTFSVASTDAIPQAKVKTAGLQEFATLAQAPSRRVFVRAPSPIQTEAIPVVAMSSNQSPATKFESLADFGFEFASAIDLFDQQPIEISEENDTLASISRFEQASMLGKYADPLNNDFTRAFDPVHSRQVTSGRLQNASFSELDDMLSSQGSRSGKSIDALTLKF